MLGCGPDENPPPPFGTGGSQGTGGSGTGGNTGGFTSTTGGFSTGGFATGGNQASGGNSSTGGGASGGFVSTSGGNSNGGSTATGGTGNGGKANGGTSNGGKSANGGTANGGKSAGGATMGGNTTGGKATGGSATGGFTTGGKASTGGSAATGGSSATGGGSSVNCSAPALSGGSQHCSSNQSGTANGFSWTIWSSGSGGCMTTYATGAAFKATWNNSGDFLAREGFQWNETKTYDQYGTIAADFAFTKTGSAGGYSYIGIYGWSNNPLIEFYIVEDWFGSGPPTGGGTLKGTFSLDGGTYKVYTHTQTNQPSIHGTQTFPQYFSVRQTARQCGHISITEHFKQWASLGMSLGKMYEAKLLVEAGGGSGSIDFSTATMTAQ
jgi:hypothetical protein